MIIIKVNNEKNLHKFNNMKKDGKMIVVFVADWCGHCQHLKPIWNSMIKTLKKDNCKGIVAMIYSDYRDRVNISHNCDGYPTIRLYKNGNKYKDWDEDWTKNGHLEKKMKIFLKSSRKNSKTKKITRRKRKKKKRKTKRRKIKK